MMMIGTILGPGSIYIMLCGALSVAFGLSNWTAFVVNLVPLIGFILICLWAKSDNQIIAAQILRFFNAFKLLYTILKHHFIHNILKFAVATDAKNKQI
jgi:chitin synthase